MKRNMAQSPVDANVEVYVVLNVSSDKKKSELKYLGSLLATDECHDCPRSRRRKQKRPLTYDHLAVNACIPKVSPN